MLWIDCLAEWYSKFLTCLQSDSSWAGYPVWPSLLAGRWCQLSAGGGLFRRWLEHLIFPMWPVREVWSSHRFPRGTLPRMNIPRVTEAEVSYARAQLSPNLAFTTSYWAKAGHRTNTDWRGGDHKWHKLWEAWFLCGHLWILAATRLS